MYNTDELVAAMKWTAITGITFVFGNITIQGLIASLQPLSWLFSIIAAFMAIRHWYYATKKIKDK